MRSLRKISMRLSVNAQSGSDREGKQYDGVDSEKVRVGMRDITEDF